PASITSQVDAGVRYAFTSKLSLVAGVFQVSKPYFNLDTSNVFGPLGTIRNRGAEISMTGSLTSDLSIVRRVVLLQRRVWGDAVPRGLTGAAPVGPQPRSGFIGVQYQVPQVTGLPLDSQIPTPSAQVGNSLDPFMAPGWPELEVGLRYNFRLFNTP